jgi:hypothetical protein
MIKFPLKLLILHVIVFVGRISRAVICATWILITKKMNAMNHDVHDGENYVSKDHLIREYDQNEHTCIEGFKTLQP